MRRERSEDEAVRQAVLRELRWDARTTETGLDVEVDHGVVTLRGAVRSWAKSLAAERAAHRAQGVRDVANELVVQLAGGAGQTETELARAVRHALAQNPQLAHEQVRTTVSAGVVALEGTVASLRELEEAEGTVRALRGVKWVVNRLRMQPLAAREHEPRQSMMRARTTLANR